MITITKTGKRIQEQDHEPVSGKRFVLAACSRCGWSGMAKASPRWIQCFKEEPGKRSHYSKPKCPFCN